MFLRVEETCRVSVVSSCRAPLGWWVVEVLRWGDQCPSEAHFDSARLAYRYRRRVLRWVRPEAVTVTSCVRAQSENVQ